MTAAADLRFVASGGRRTGLGHALRCATLAALARRRGLHVDVRLRGDAAAAQTLARELPGIAVEPWTRHDEPADGAGALVLDTPEALAPVLARARAKGVRTLVLDRTDQLDAADWTVLPVLHAPPVSHPRVRQGASWCVIDPAARGLTPPPFPGARDRLLVLLGGADPRGLTARIAGWLAEAPPSAVAPTFVLGPAMGQADRLAAELAGRGWEVLRAPSRLGLFEAMGRARAAIVAFGLSLYELAFLGTPAVVVTHGPETLADARRLEALGIGLLAGDGTSEACAQALRNALRGLWAPGALERCHARARAAVGDGSGARRIVDLAVGQTGSSLARWAS